ncbi:M56 family metallopeptidase [Arenimonas sp. MALMAid1274]|uniref:M56 family metallopeptidase n=1 Tax=Arenimonas sp. MALMAid1274 TaxID=3411630 RepID=UPI003B9F492C
MSRDLLQLLIEGTLSTSAAIVLVLLLRQPLRAAFGAGAAYAAWSLVPVALLAVALPAAVVPVAPSAGIALPAIATIADTAAPAAAIDVRLAWLGLWALGALGMAAFLLRQQRRFTASLGALVTRSDGLLQSDSAAGLPAVIGWRARIVLPADFETRYDAAQQQLVLCHEQVHQRRGDLPVNAGVSLLRCLLWFNPLVHHAAERLRQDQELACDAAVLARFPRHRRAYGEALLKTQLADRPLPVGCHWFGSHPLKERIAMLKRPLPGRTRVFSGFMIVFALATAGGWSAWAAQPARAIVVAPAEGELGVTMTVRIDGQQERVQSLNLRAGEAHRFEFEQSGAAWVVELALTPREDGTVFADAEILRDGVSQGSPKLIFKPGEPGAAMSVGEQDAGGGFRGIALELVVRLPEAKVAAEVAPVSGPMPWTASLSRWTGAAPPEPAC